MKQQLGGLGVVDLLTAKEMKETLDDSLGSRLDNLVRDLFRADKFMRVPLVTGTPAGSALSIDSTVGPRQGYAWDISMLGMAGLSTGTTPDIVNMLFNGGPQLPFWQFNGNNFAYTFSRGQMVMLPGETISLRSVGTLAATGTITLYGAIRTEMPAEKLGMTFA